MDQYLKNLAGELLNLEVNTIIKENTTGAKMPSNKRVALLEIANEYRHLLIEYGLCQKADGRPPQQAKDGRPKTLLRWEGAGEYSFVEIKQQAAAGKQYYEGVVPMLQDDNAKDVLKKRIRLLARIESQSSNIIGIFKIRRKRFSEQIELAQEGFSSQATLPAETSNELLPFTSQLSSHLWNNDLSLRDINKVEDMDLAPDNITVIRKAWEIGTQQILLQTVIQIDGDVTNYMTNHFISLPEDIRSIALNLHNDATNEATKQWSTLFKTVSQLAGKALGQLFGKN
ncbi:hypothetical protein V6R21_10365 [Limibacter armeniacum]|uniref:hypothetical protein n=1 Tax=Limibacter armeniacum TaxID=466084 RepID=UPI002FE54E39